MLKLIQRICLNTFRCFKCIVSKMKALKMYQKEIRFTFIYLFYIAVGEKNDGILFVCHEISNFVDEFRDIFVLFYCAE